MDTPRNKLTGAIARSLEKRSRSLARLRQFHLQEGVQVLGEDGATRVSGIHHDVGKLVDGAPGGGGLPVPVQARGRVASKRGALKGDF